MKRVMLRPVDTWFFRDATPFTAGSAPQEGVASIFPPHPRTVAGALRAAIARCNGWDGRGRWPDELNEVLGNGPGDLGRLNVSGPLLLRDGRPLFRCPRNVLGASDDRGRWSPGALLRPGPAVQCDLGDDVRLPQVAEGWDRETKLKAKDDAWITAAGMRKVLSGLVPNADDIVSATSLWAIEERIGLQRDNRTRAAAEGMLYSTRHVRPRGDIALGVQVAGVPADWRFPRGLLPLGGESRLAECTAWDGSLDVPAAVHGIQARNRFSVVAVTPLDLEPEVIRGSRPLKDLGEARVVSACLRRPLRIGGWDSLERRPLALRSVLAPGSVLFCETPRPLGLAAFARDGRDFVSVGSHQPWGFGRVALGRWPMEPGG